MGQHNRAHQPRLQQSFAVKSDPTEGLLLGSLSVWPWISEVCKHHHWAHKRHACQRPPLRSAACYSRGFLCGNQCRHFHATLATLLCGRGTFAFDTSFWLLWVALLSVKYLLMQLGSLLLTSFVCMCVCVCRAADSGQGQAGSGRSWQAAGPRRHLHCPVLH